MSFRVSTSSSFLLFQRTLGIANQNVNKHFEQLSSGKKINRPSDDPEGVKSIAGYRETQARIEQYLKNLQAADRSWTQTETAIGRVNETLIRARELAVQGNNGTLGINERRMIAAEVNQLAQELLSAANTEINGEYIFAGFRNNEKPFALAPDYPNADPAVIFSGDSNIRRVEINDGQTFELHMAGDDVFLGDGSADSADLFQTLANLEQALLSNNTDDDDPASIGQSLEDLNNALQQTQRNLASVGAKTRRIETAREALGFQSELLTNFIEERELIDLPTAVYQFEKANMALQATVSSAGAVLKMPSLMDFLR
jgi:flagellar hook-associated protein 3 FlgL